jgi:hypothetical protein
MFQNCQNIDEDKVLKVKDKLSFTAKAYADVITQAAKQAQK